MAKVADELNRAQQLFEPNSHLDPERWAAGASMRLAAARDLVALRSCGSSGMPGTKGCGLINM